MFKKLSILCMVLFVFGWMSGSAFAQATYFTNPTGDMSLAVGVCETRTVSVDGSTFGTEPLISGGMLVRLSDPTRVAINTVACYDSELTPAVWDAGSFKVPNPAGYPGGYYVATSNLGAGVIPSSNILVCDVEFCGIADGNPTITIETIPDFDTWVGSQSGFVFDPTIADAVINVTVTGAAACGNGTVEAGEDCDDGNTADGDCCSATCTFEAVDSPCADGAYCNGDETCDGAGTCQPGTPVVCADDGLYCNGTESCNEDTDSCVSSGDPCGAGTVCNE
jgi:cysteine-rich repeat protein